MSNYTGFHPDTIETGYKGYLCGTCYTGTRNIPTIAGGECIKCHKPLKVTKQQLADAAARWGRAKLLITLVPNNSQIYYITFQHGRYTSAALYLSVVGDAIYSLSAYIHAAFPAYKYANDGSAGLLIRNSAEAEFELIMSQLGITGVRTHRI